jgi:hypothetical protein
MTNGKGKFEEDLNVLLSRLTTDMNSDAKRKLTKLKDDLVNLQKANIVKINHSVMELVCAKYLVQRDYEVLVEHQLNDILTCDLFATKGLGNLIVEIETGYIPPEHAMDPLTYTFARLASKIIRYSSFAGKFAIGVPPHYVLPFPKALTLAPRRRTTVDVEQIKALCDWYYQKPPVTEEEIRNARIHEIYVIDVDRTRVQEIDPEGYMKRALSKGAMYTLKEEPTPELAKAVATLISRKENLDRYMK